MWCEGWSDNAFHPKALKHTAKSVCIADGAVVLELRLSAVHAVTHPFAARRATLQDFELIRMDGRRKSPRIVGDRAAVPASMSTVGRQNEPAGEEVLALQVVVPSTPGGRCYLCV